MLAHSLAATQAKWHGNRDSARLLGSRCQANGREALDPGSPSGLAGDKCGSAASEAGLLPQ